MSQEVREILWTRKTAMQEVREILWTSTSGYTVTSNDPGNVAMLSLQNLPWHLGVVCVHASVLYCDSCAVLQGPETPHSCKHFKTANSFCFAS